ncbi:hypothetical protein [Umezawaea sp.]
MRTTRPEPDPDEDDEPPTPHAASTGPDASRDRTDLRVTDT